VDEEHNEIPARLGSSQSGINVFATSMPILDETEESIALDDVTDLIARDSVLTVQFLGH
jgi:hypothetical protein